MVDKLLAFIESNYSTDELLVLNDLSAYVAQNSIGPVAPEHVPTSY